MEDQEDMEDTEVCRAEWVPCSDAADVALVWRSRLASLRGAALDPVRWNLLSRSLAVVRREEMTPLRADDRPVEGAEPTLLRSP